MTNKKTSFAIMGRRVVHPLGAPSWSMLEGPRPHTEDFEIPTGHAASFAPDGTPSFVSVRIDDNAREEPTTIEGLFVLQVGPSAVPHIDLMTIVDQRYFWPSKHLFRRFNMRRTIGHRRISSPSALELRDVTDDVWYWAESLRGYVAGDSASGQPWTIGHIAETMAYATYQFVRSELWAGCPEPIIDPPNVLGTIVPQNFELDDDLATCWARLLSYAPSIKLSIAANGAIVVEARRRVEAEAELEAAVGADQLLRAELGPEVWGSGHAKVVARGNERPRAIIVLVTPEHEVRFDYKEPTSIEDSYVEPAAEDRQLVNVVGVSDYTLGNYVQGDFIPFAEAIGLWNADLPAAVSFTFDWQILRACIVPFMDLATTLRQEAGNLANADWGGRIDAMQQHFRRTYRLPRAWLDACMDILDVRVAVANPETGDRAGAPVYSDWYRLYGRRNHLRQFMFSDQFLTHGSNNFGYPTGGLLTNETVQAPARVRLFNKDLGLFTLMWEQDPTRMTEQTIPGTIMGTTAPTGNLRSEENAVAFDNVIRECEDFNSVPQMTPGYLMTVILTCIPAGSRLDRIVISPSDVGTEMLPGKPEDYSGPPMEIRIPRTAETARWAWRDDAASQIAERFGLLQGAGDVPRELLLNYDGQGVAGASIWEIARAAALREWWRLADRYQGTSEHRLTPVAKLVGNASIVTQQLTPDGTATTRVAYPQDIPQPPLEALLSEGTRALIMRTPQRGSSR